MATIGKGNYKVQLLLSESAARFVRAQMLDAIQKGGLGIEEEDIAYAAIAEIASQLRR